MILTKTTRNKWFTNYNAVLPASERLFCFPYSGGGSPVFRSWIDAVPGVEITGALLPGRERRLTEPPLGDLDHLLEPLMDAMAPLLDRPYSVFGHSMGALIGFELIRKLRRSGLPGPRRFFASAFRSPERANPNKRIHHLPDPQFVEELRGYGGTPEGIFSNEEMLGLVLPALKADFRLHEAYSHRAEQPLDCPITAFAGTEDKVVPEGEMRGWEAHTRDAHRLKLIRGGHFFIHENPSALLAEINRDLRGRD